MPSVGGGKSICDMLVNRQAGRKTTATSKNAFAFRLCCFLPAVFQQRCTAALNAVNLRHRETQMHHRLWSSSTLKLSSFHRIANDDCSVAFTSAWRLQMVDLTLNCGNFNAKKELGLYSEPTANKKAFPIRCKIAFDSRNGLSQLVMKPGSNALAGWP